MKLEQPDSAFGNGRGKAIRFRCAAKPALPNQLCQTSFAKAA
ncbi:hypothetical protein NYE69_08355 [Paenibacillus sp. FSL R5-0527]